MRLIQSQDDLYASFSKRRLGLFKKAGELSTLCGADIGIIVFSPTDNPFSFFSPNMESVIERYINPDQPLKHSARALDAHARARIQVHNKQLDQVQEQKLKLKQVDEGLVEIDRTRQKGWWEETSIDSLDKEQVGEWIAWFNNFKDRVENQIQQQQNGGSMNQLQNVSIQNYYSPADQFGGGGAGDHLLGQCYYPSPPLDSQYFYRPPPQRASSPFFSPQYRYYVTPGAQDPFGAGAGGSGGGDDSGQYGFPPTLSTYLVDPSSVADTGQHFQPLNQSTTLSFPPHYRHVYSGAQNLSDANEDTSNQNQGGN